MGFLFGVKVVESSGLTVMFSKNFIAHQNPVCYTTIELKYTRSTICANVPVSLEKLQPRCFFYGLGSGLEMRAGTGFHKVEYCGG